MQQQRIKPKGIYAVLNGAASNFRFVKEFPTAAENVMDCNHWADPRKPRTAQVMAEVEKAGKVWLYNTPLNYSSVLLLADAIERAGAAIASRLSKRSPARPSLTTSCPMARPNSSKARTWARSGQHAGAER